jgi:hypothetical protein
MKKVIFYVIFLLFALALSANAQPRRNRGNNPPRSHQGRRAVGAPLDAAVLLLALGGGGAAYYAIRKNKKS